MFKELFNLGKERQERKTAFMKAVRSLLRIQRDMNFPNDGILAILDTAIGELVEKGFTPEVEESVTAEIQSYKKHVLGIKDE